MRYLIPAAILVVLILYFFVLSGDDTSEIEGVFDDIIEAARAKDQEGVLERFSIHYKDDTQADDATCSQGLRFRLRPRCSLVPRMR